MLSFHHIDILDLIIKGILIGIIASAPMGPVGVLCIQRTMNKGRWYGFITGLGASISDMIYAIITGLGMSFVMDFINSKESLFILKIIGSVLLLVFGIYCFKSKPKKRIHKTQKQKGSFYYNALTGFGITIVNPLIILLFIATFAQFAFVIPNHTFEMSIGYFSIFTGAMLWWFGLTWLIDKIRGKFEDNGVIIINKIIGSIVIFFSIIFLIGTIFNLYSIHY